jgi:hypothetical protein
MPNGSQLLAALHLALNVGGRDTGEVLRTVAIETRN